MSRKIGHFVRGSKLLLVLVEQLFRGAAEFFLFAISARQRAAHESVPG